MQAWQANAATTADVTGSLPLRRSPFSASDVATQKHVDCCIGQQGVTIIRASKETSSSQPCQAGVTHAGKG